MYLVFIELAELKFLIQLHVHVSRASSNVVSDLRKNTA